MCITRDIHIHMHIHINIRIHIYIHLYIHMHIHKHTYTHSPHAHTLTHSPNAPQHTLTGKEPVRGGQEEEIVQHRINIQKNEELVRPKPRKTPFTKTHVSGRQMKVSDS